MDVGLRRRIGRQHDLVATWQLVAVGWSPRRVRHWSRKEGWRRIHDGVWALGQAPLTTHQVWIAAVLTAPRTYLAGPSACCCHGFLERIAGDETVVRPGSGGPRRYPGLLVSRSTTLAGQTTTKDRLPLVVAERALIDVAPLIGGPRLARAFREAVRVRATTADEVSRALAGQRGTRLLRDLCDRYATIPYHRCRSDAEARALEILHDAGVPRPRVNVRVAGREADLVWHEHRLVVEVDGPQFHLFADRDAEKAAGWRSAGYTVVRIPSGDVYRRPATLLSLVNGHLLAP